MNRWWRRVLAVLTIGGGFMGVITNIGIMADLRSKTAGALILYSVVALLYGYGIVLGVRLAEKTRIDWQIIIFYLIQIPWFASPEFSYHFSSGVHAVVGFVQGHFDTSFHAGTQWQFTIHKMLPWMFGVNLFALVAVVTLIWGKRRQRKEPDRSARSERIRPPTTSPRR